MNEQFPMDPKNTDCPSSLQDPSTKAAASSRLPGFYELPVGERVTIAGRFAGLTPQEVKHSANFGALSGELTDVFIENAVGTFALPLGVATNFLVNDREVLVPMAVEETSVLAAASHGAKLARAGGGFRAEATDPIMTGQIQLFLDGDRVAYDEILYLHKADLLAFANKNHERLLERGGGAKDMDWRYIPEIKSLIIHLYVDTRDAMGANIVNTMCERVSGVMPEMFPCEIGLRILTNLTDHRRARASCFVPHQAFETPEFSGREVVDRIEKAFQFAWYDPHRATTNNKGIMNGIDPVIIATGNDWRAVEAGAHAWASRTGTYRPMAVWRKTSEGDLEGHIEIPMAIGTVGGVTKLHPTVQSALKLLGNPDAKTLAGIVVSVGLAQNLSALRALASEGIQRGHMSLHQRNLDLLRRQGATRA